MHARARHSFAVVIALVLVAATPMGAVAKGKPAPPPAPSVEFAGYTWTVKDHARKIGPGPNFFSANNVWVDQDGLHLAIRKAKNKWTTAEVILNGSFGYGTYSWTIGSTPAFDPNVVLGLFTWNDDPAYNHREIDIEYARWGNAADPNNAQYVVQPWSTVGNEHRWRDTHLVAGMTHSFTWAPGAVSFESRLPNGTLAHSWTYDGPDVPLPGGENARINFWLYRGSAPLDGRDAHVVISDFTYTAP